jgi:hypothetical protein
MGNDVLWADPKQYQRAVDVANKQWYDHLNPSEWASSITNAIGDSISSVLDNVGRWLYGFWCSFIACGVYIGLILIMIGLLMSMPKLYLHDKVLKVGLTIFIICEVIKIVQS